MTLGESAVHPGHRSYVVKLHRDAHAAAGALRGRIENLATGRRRDFEDAQGLLEALLADLAQPDPQDDAAPA